MHSAPGPRAQRRAKGAGRRDLLSNTLFASPGDKGYGALIAEHRYEPPGFTMRLGAKDVRLVVAAAEAAGVPMSFASILRDDVIDAISHGDGDKDFVARATMAAQWIEK